MTIAFLNGRFYGGAAADAPLAQALVSAFDAGLQHGVGLFETMLGGVVVRGVETATTHGEEVEGWVLHLDEHLERLAGSARALGLSEQLRAGALGDAVMETVRRSKLPKARVRLTITGGDLSMLAAAQAGASPRSVDPTVLIVAQPATEYPAAMFERGVRVVLADARANPLDPSQGHKTLNYWWRLRELQSAARKGAGEALVLSVTNHVSGGCVSNILLVRGDEVITPIARGEEKGGGGGGAAAVDPEDIGAIPKPESGKRPALPSPVLPGVTRGWALERLERWGLTVRKRMIGVQDVIDADEVVLTNSSWGVVPVVQVEANPIGTGTPGRFAADLRDAWTALQPSDVAEEPEV